MTFSSRRLVLAGRFPQLASMLCAGWLLAGCSEDPKASNPTNGGAGGGVIPGGAGMGSPSGGNGGGVNGPGAAGSGGTAPPTSGGMGSGGVPASGGTDSGAGAPAQGGTGGGSVDPLAGSGGGSGGGEVSSGEVPVIPFNDGQLKVEICAPHIVRVAYAKAAGFFTRSSLVTAPKVCPGAAWTQTTAGDETTIATSRLQVRVNTKSGAVAFADSAGKAILSEKAGGRVLTPAMVQGEQTFNVRQEWEPNADEALYGLGQHQDNILDVKGHDIELKQYNAQIAIPFLASSRGYGILWDNTSYSKFGDLRPFEPLPGTTGLYVGAADPGAVAPGAGSVSWTGTVPITATGDYQFQTFSSGDVKLWVNDQLVIDHWRQGWLTATDAARVRLTAGQPASIRLQWTSDIAVNAIRLLWKTPAPTSTTSLWSEVGDGSDYYFVYGPELDTVIAGYRQLTGRAPMLPRSAFGLWQSRERYQSAQQVEDTLAGFRSRNIPIDNIVQDWQYWVPTGWGSHQFDPARFPDPAAWIKRIHDVHKAKLMISVWPKFYTGTANYEALRAAGFLYQLNITEQRKDFVGYTFTYYDAFNPAARKMYWDQMNRELFSKGVDAWWMDATEPDIVEGPFLSPTAQLEAFRTHMHPTALGAGSRVLNAYSLVNSQAVYEGQRATAPDQRVFILTRNGFAGQQRYGAVSWSGDVTSTWTALKQQIPAGLSFSISGLPYWTVDSGGFAVPPRFAAATPTAANLEEWRELNTRWFQYATFLPLLRVHGQAPVREMWAFGGDTSPTYLAQLKFNRLRYRLLPYLYSLAGKITHEGGTMLRPLVMDFAADARALQVKDQFLCGPALMVTPVTTYQERMRSVYLPAGSSWFDFWTGSAAAAGAVQVAAPYDAIPVHVRGGSIVPMGPELAYTSEKPADPITLWVYGGANGSFSLYEDDGSTYGYEKGAFSRIPLSWNDATRTLTIGKREGTFPGILAMRTFQVVLVTAGKAVPFSFTPTADKTVAYTGEEVAVPIP